MLRLNKSFEVTDLQLKDKCLTALGKLYKNPEVGFLRLPEMERLWFNAHDLGIQFRNDCTELVIVGVGGSSLGARAISEIFFLKNIYFIDNVDAIDFERTLKSIKNPLKTGWVFISKSGTTIETLCALDFIEQWHNQNSFSEFTKRSIVISEFDKNSLTDWAKSNSIPILEIPKNVGGRFSVLSPVGMFMSAFSALDVDLFKAGAARALNDKQLIVEFMAQTLQSYARQEWITLFWFYMSNMRFFGGWLQQLWAESLGKKIDNYGKPAPRTSTPVTAIGASDQHSILQQVIEGYKDKFVVFLRSDAAEGGSFTLEKNNFKETLSIKNKKMGELLAAEAVATEEALNAYGVSTLSFKTKVLDEESLGYLFMFFQVAVAGLGEVLEINAFNQPGVELGKRLAKEKLS